MSDFSESLGAGDGQPNAIWGAYLRQNGFSGKWPESIARVLGPRVFNHVMASPEGAMSEDYIAQMTNEGNQINRTVPVDLSNAENVRAGVDLAHDVAIACNIGEQLLSSYTAAHKAAKDDADFHYAIGLQAIESKPVRVIGKTMANCRQERTKNTGIVVGRIESLLDERRGDTLERLLVPEEAAHEDSALLPLTPAAISPRGKWRDETQYIGFETDEPVEDPVLAAQMAHYVTDLEEAQITVGQQLHTSLEFVRAAEAASGHMDSIYSLTGQLAVQLHGAITNLAAQDVFYLESAMDVISEELAKRYELARLDYSFGIDNSAEHRKADELLQTLVTPGEYYAR